MHQESSDRMWPLDLSIAAVAGLVLYLIVTQLRIDDPRWQFNALTYAIAVPAIALILDFILRGAASHYVQKSVQLGFLFSVFLHLLLLMLAVNVILFSRYFPDAFTGVKPERSPVRRTVPEYLFRTTEERVTEPDWSKPTEAETASPVVPREQRQLPPVEHTAPKLEMPQPRDPVQRPTQKHLMKRDQPTESQPQPANAPAKLARRRTSTDQAMSEAIDSPTAPSVPVPSEMKSRSPERDMARPARSQPQKSDLAMTLPTKLPKQTEQEPSLAGARHRSDAMPKVGDSGLRQQKRQRFRARQVEPAGAAPAPPSVAVARLDEMADRMISPAEPQFQRQDRVVGAQLTLGETPASALNRLSNNAVSGSETTRSDLAASAGMPNISAGSAVRAPGLARRASPGAGLAPAGLPDPNESVATSAVGDASSGSPQEVSDRLAPNEPAFDSVRSSNNSTRSTASDLAGPSFDIRVEEGPVGLADLPSRTTGVVPSDEQPKVAVLDLSSGTRPRRELGGPVTPFGSKVAAVESFSRRVMRTDGGAAPTPAGMVGPATEEAIERGLAYLASIQNDDGSWSLQGLGTNVVLRSDSAATGLCLLAFQGAGYTHRQHQYADTVSRGLKFMIDNQRTNGDLYRPEDPLSNRNVAFYSHGIAALALSEAFGMTQDPELKEPAQMALNFIAATQHRTRGGWRYSAQVSSDTSVSGWMMMALKSGQLSGLEAPEETYQGIEKWLEIAKSPDRDDRYRYNPYAPDTPSQRHGRMPTPTMTAVGMLMRMYSGWRRDTPAMQSAADYLLEYPPQMGTTRSPQRDAYYWYYATQVMFHMGGDHWADWNRHLNAVLLESQLKDGPFTGSWDPVRPVPDRWSKHAGRLYVTTMNLLNLEVYYRHLPIYEDTAE